jgi:hypothetical protein
MMPRFRLISVCCVFVAATSAAFGAGEYQQTRDSKTMIWNGTPKAGETSTWSGDRDKENYATGFGDLTIYNASGKAYALYYGNMVRGKFEGPVNVHTNGRTSHAYFVDGNRATAWGWGAAKSTMTASEAAVVEKRRAEAEKIAAARKKEETKPAPTPVKKNEIAEKIKETPAQPTEHVAKATETYQAEATPEPPAVTKEKTKPTPAETNTLARAEPSETPVRAFLEPTPLPKIAESPPPPIEETPVPAESPAAEEKIDSTAKPPEVARESTEKKKNHENVSVNALVGPPSSLRSTDENSSERSSAGPAASESDRLNESDAVNLADTEARNQGYNLENYERPKADYSEVKRKWILYYDLKKSADRGLGVAPLSVTVEDRSKKVEIRK